jgi:hypothetical protein
MNVTVDPSVTGEPEISESIEERAAEAPAESSEPAAVAEEPAAVAAEPAVEEPAAVAAEPAAVVEEPADAESPEIEGEPEPQPVDSPADPVPVAVAVTEVGVGLGAEETAEAEVEEPVEAVDIDLDLAASEAADDEPVSQWDTRLTVLSVLVGVLAVAVMTVFSLIVFDPVSLVGIVPNWFAEPGSTRTGGVLAVVLVAAGVAYAMRQAYLRRR